MDSPCLKRWCKLGSCQYSLHKVLWYSKVFVLYCLHFSIFYKKGNWLLCKFTFDTVDWTTTLSIVLVPLIWLVWFLELMEVCQSLNSARCDIMFYIILLNTFLKRKKAQPIVLNWWAKVREGWTSWTKGMQMVKFQEHEPSLQLTKMKLRQIQSRCASISHEFHLTIVLKYWVKYFLSFSVIIVLFICFY